MPTARPLLLCASLLLACLLSGSVQVALAQSTAEGETQDRPNIVFIFSDDHAVQALGAYEDRLAHLDPTPEIDRLAEEGMLFRNAFVTNSICAPSRATILSGQHSHVNGVRTNRRGDSLAASVQTFPELLQDAGYQTAMVGKWHLKSDPQGFNYWEVLPGQGAYYNPTFLRPSDTTQYTGYVSEIITDRAVRWLREEQSGDSPFLLMYQHKAPHRNWQPGPDHLTTYDDVTVPAPRTLFYDYSGLSTPAVMQEMEISTDLRWGWDLKLRVQPGTGDSTGWQERLTDRFTPEQRAAWTAAYGPKNEAFYEAYRDDDLQGRDLTRWKYQRYIKDYLRSIRSMDDQIGRLLDELDRQGLFEETIVVYASDQGFFLGEKGWFDKRWMYEESLRMPLLVRWPGVVEPGSESTALVQNLDLAQTFLDAAGVQAPDGMQGRSLTPLLRGSVPTGWRESIYYHYYEYPNAPHSVMRHEGVRTERYKLINHYWADQWALFDLRTDPHELNNVYGHPDYAEVTERLKRQLRRLKTQYDVPADVTEAGPSQATQ